MYVIERPHTSSWFAEALKASVVRADSFQLYSSPFDHWKDWKEDKLLDREIKIGLIYDHLHSFSFQDNWLWEW